jgi:gamma-tubulin complex component 2
MESMGTKNQNQVCNRYSCNLYLQPVVNWKPQASLIQHTTAPLACRVSIPPLSSTIPSTLEPVKLRDLSADAQEAAMLDDLLYTFMGFEGQYIHFADSYSPAEEKERLVGPKFKIPPGLDPSLADLTSSMLDMATHYVAVDAFIDVQSREEFGSVNHALCASMRKHLKDYLILIAQMENQIITNESFTLHVLNLHILPTSNILFQLYSLAQEILKKNKLLEDDVESDESDIDNLIEQLKDGGDLLGGKSKIQKGGNVIRLLTDRLSHFSGDPAARKLLEGLLRDASKPYMDMLNEWLHRGSIRDPHGEFLIREQKSINRDKLEEDFTDAYWEKRYTIREHDVPPQLDAVKERVLLAGKYLNVVRECGGVDISKEVQDVPRTFEDPRFLINISDAYAHANSSLLNLLLTTHELSARLRSLKHYFFLDRSDFFSAFLYLGNSELKKSAKDVNVGKLQSLLDLVLHQPGSVSAQDPFKEDIKIRMNDQNLTKFLMSVVNVKGFEEGKEENLPRRSLKNDEEEAKKMSGFDALEFKYTVPFPLSLVISSKTVVRYQIIFRYLLSLRHLENMLVNSWEDHNKVSSWTHRSTDRRLEMWKRRAWALRARMLNFVQSFMYYCTAEVIEPNWHLLMEKVNGRDKNGKPASRTVDELMEDHVDFLDTCLKECMLMNPKLLKVSHLSHCMPNINTSRFETSS